MTMPNDLFEYLVCPVTKQRLKSASQDVVDRLNARIHDKNLRTVSAHIVESAVDGALVREDGRIAYLVRSGIPILLKDEAVSLE